MTSPRPPRRAFTLVELLVVMGLIGTLISLLMPAVARARSAARATACLSNLRQMGAAWSIYTAENRGRLPAYTFRREFTPDVAWHGYWPGLLEAAAVRGNAVLCPAAAEPIDSPQYRGYGNVNHAWTGRYSSTGALKLSATVYRQGSYGFNRNLTAGSGYGDDGKATAVTQVRNPSDVPLFFDCAYADVSLENGSEAAPASSPPDLNGAPPGSPDHWQVLIARHGRGVNACMADGSARYVPLNDLYMLTWNGRWSKYRLSLPGR